MKVAVSSQNFRTVTGHAGKGRRFLIYEVGEVGVTECDRLDLPIGMAIHDYGPEDAHPLDEVDVLVTASCGSGFVGKMARRKVEVFRTEERDPLLAVQKLLNLDF
jgi:predicted Fe-Mo cluster-binding NifX family protein